MRIVTIDEIEYRLAFSIEHHTIPAGTPCIPADNLPEGLTPKYWACEWDGISDAASSYARTYGFLLSDDEVEGIDCEPDVAEAIAILAPTHPFVGSGNRKL